MTAVATSTVGRLGAHDVGGSAELATDVIDTKDRPYADWERQVHAGLVELLRLKLITVDELRRGIEGLEGSVYKQLSYYEKWIASIVTILVERNVVTREEIESELDEHPVVGEHPAAQAQVQRKEPYKVGDSVVVKDEGVIRRWRKPHLRIPGYIHGAVGTVEQVVGRFEDPSYVAYRIVLSRVNGPPEKDAPLSAEHRRELQRQHGGMQFLYVVRFPMSSLALLSYIEKDHQRSPNTKSKTKAGTGDEDAHNTVTAEVFHPWLRMATAEERIHGRALEQQEANVEFHSGFRNSGLVTQDQHNAPAQCPPDGTNAIFSGNGEKTPSEKAKDAEEKKKESALRLQQRGSDIQHLDRMTTEINAIVNEGPEKPLQPLAEALWRLLDRRGIVSLLEIRKRVEALDGLKEKGYGAKLVARAWIDPEFKHRLLADPNRAAKEIGIATSNYVTAVSLHPDQKPGYHEHPLGFTLLKVVENTPQVHHLVVCTLCSCYPVSLLGLSPDWYKSRSYRAQAILRPRAMLRESFGLVIPTGQRIEVHDSTAEIRYLVLPLRPKWTEGMSEEQLEKLITRDSMIGVGVIEESTSGTSRSKL